ncbi:hypothetical protein SIID45300_00021 [Candidatus Magnetaquicoccaceae bacterium FCR-1]|uniref:Uncharacterized protein n=1 Tax=Candidatus Magnetaquiglobus chichijimensis TaxID=3141448 RepID=A0ABQ0C4A9_9PROT
MAGAERIEGAKRSGQRAQVRAAFLESGGNLALAARQHGVAESTARRWRRMDQQEGVPWESQPNGTLLDRAAGCLVGNRRERMVSAMLEEYLELHKEAVAAVKNGEVKPLDRVDALSKLSQALDRTLRALGKASPELSRLAIAKWVLERQAEFVRNHHPDWLEMFVEILEPFGEELVTCMTGGETLRSASSEEG